MSAINAAIPLQGQVPQAEGPIDMARGGLNVQQLINAVQLQKQQQASNAIAQQQQQIELQQQKYQLQDQETMRSLAPQFVGKNKDGIGTFDFEGLANAAQARGVNPSTVNQMRMQQYQLQEAASKAGSEKLANEQAHNKAAYEILEGVKGITDPDERQKAYQVGLNRLSLLGMDTSHLPTTAPDSKGIEAFETQLGMHGQLIADAKTLAETNEKNATAAEKEWQKFPELGVMVNTKTGEQRQVAGQAGAMTPAMIESKYLAIQQRKQMGGPVTAEENAFEKSVEKYKTLVPQLTNFFSITGGGLGPSSGATAPAAATPKSAPQNALGGWASEGDGKTLNDVPAAIKDEVRQVLEYRRADPSITQRGPVGQAINAWVAKLDPQHDATTFPAKNKILQEYTKDASTGEIGAINTALGHLGDLNEAAKALSSSNLPLLHSIASKWGIATGGTPETIYNGILHRVGPEMTKAYVKGGGTEGERGSNEDDFALSKGQAQIQNNIFESANLLNSKLASKRNAWQTTFQPYRDQDNFDQRWITPEARQTLQNLGSKSPLAKKGGAGAKTLTSAQVAQAAKDHNVSVEEATRQAKAAGYEVKE